MRERDILLITVISLGLLGFGVATALLAPPVIVAATSRAVLVDQMLRILFAGAATVFVAVEGLLVFGAIRGRVFGASESKSRVARGLEALWILIPALIVAAIAVYSIQVLGKVEAPAAAPLRVEVTGRQFEWRFHYPDTATTSDELHLPVDQPVVLEFTSLDVIHSFWVPAFGGKVDALPGRTTSLQLTPHLKGEYLGMCAELCGEGHTTMVARVLVEDESDFQAWLSGD